MPIGSDNIFILDNLVFSKIGKQFTGYKKKKEKTDAGSIND